MRLRLDVPEDWSINKVVRLANWLAEWEFILGHRIEFPEWRSRFFPKASKVAAMRQWERRKHDLVKAGIQFELTEFDCWGGVRPLLFKSRQYMREVVEALIGPQDRYPVFVPRSYLKSIDDFDPSVAERFRETVTV